MAMSVRSHLLFQENPLQGHKNMSAKGPGLAGQTDPELQNVGLWTEAWFLALTRKIAPRPSPKAGGRGLHAELD